MSTLRSQQLLPSRRNFPTYLLALVLTAIPAVAQTLTSSITPAITEANLSLPDSPGAVSSSLTAEASAPAFQTTPTGQGVMAGHLDKYIEPGQRVPTLRIGDKVLLGIRNSATPLAPAGWLLVAGYSQVINSTPNYGTDGKAFAQRLGAAAARGSSESIFADSIMASVLHEDPRYYKMGPQHSFFQRTVYSVTRVLITRTDGGRTTPNLSFLSGNLAAAALTQAYYPAVDRGFRPVLKTYGGAVAGGALTYLGREFFGDARDWFQRRKSK